MADRDMSEIERRELADAHRGEVVPGSGSPVEGRRLGQMVSVRLEADTIAALREVATRRGMTVSDLLREGAGMVLASDQQTGTVSFWFRTSISFQPRDWGNARHSLNPTEISQGYAATA